MLNYFQTVVKACYNNQGQERLLPALCVVATSALLAGEEVTINYLDETDKLSISKDRAQEARMARRTQEDHGGHRRSQQESGGPSRIQENP